MTDVFTLPPEVLSGWLYAGPGAASLHAAATAWSALATELAAAAADYRAVPAALTAQDWTGPSAAAMAAAAERYAGWLASTAERAGQTGASAAAAAEAFETALAAAVPPAVIAANRTERRALAAGPHAVFHLPQIAALDAAYLGYWAQDVAAMLAYAGQAAAATRLDGFTPAPATTRGDGGSRAAGAAAAHTAAGQLRSAIPQLLQTMSGSAGGSGAAAGTGGLLESLQTSWTNLFNSFGNVTKWEGFGNAAMSVPNFGMVQFKTFFKPLSVLPDIPKSALGAGLGGAGMSSLGAGLGAGITGPTGPLSGGFIRAITADAGGAPRVGGLSVPTGWATATPAVRLAATALPAAPLPEGLAAMVSPAGLGAATGGALGAVPGTRLINAGGPRVGAAAGGGGGAKAPMQLDKVLAQLQKSKDAVQHWSVDEAHLDDLLEELSKKPGFHAVHLSKTPKPEPIPAAAEIG